MDRFLAPHTPEAVAHHVTLNSNSWDFDTLDEALVANCASYQAISRFIKGDDLFILPNSRSQLESILRRYSYDAIHNIIAQARCTLQAGGYGRICVQAETSINRVLNTSDNASTLLGLYCCPAPKRTHKPEECPLKMQSIKSN